MKCWQPPEGGFSIKRKEKSVMKLKSKCFSPKERSWEENLWAVEEQTGRRIPEREHSEKRG